MVLNIHFVKSLNHLTNLEYEFRVGLNKLRKGEKFDDDDRALCGFPGFHFASRSWCADQYPDRQLEALIRIPKNARVCEPWATDGHAQDQLRYAKIRTAPKKNCHASILCKCPACEKLHRVKLYWTGNGIPRKYCRACIRSHFKYKG